MSRSEPNWPSELRLSLFDESDGTADGSAPDSSVSAEPSGFGIPVRWCVLLTLVALVLAAASGSLLKARRGHTVTSTVLRYQHPQGVDLSGCPRGDECYPL